MDAQLQVVRKLEEKERLLQGTISTAERELALRTQALDMNKRKVKPGCDTFTQDFAMREKTKSPLCLQAQESATLSEEVRVQLEQVQQRLSLVREEVVENSISREKESFNARRAQVSTRPSKCNISVKRLQRCAVTFVFLLICAFWKIKKSPVWSLSEKVEFKTSLCQKVQRTLAHIHILDSFKTKIKTMGFCPLQNRRLSLFASPVKR